MDRGKKAMELIANRSLYMDFKDVIREHALRFLPAKALRRCTAVCRDWKLHISSPFFAHNQTLSFRGISGFFYQPPSGAPSFISLDPLAYGVPDPSLSFLPEPVDLRCASSGLVCCQGHTGYKAYYVCNPVTSQWKKLPKHNADHGCDPAIVLVYEPSLLNFVAEYKLVCAFPSDLDGYEFEIYSSTEGSWRISGEICFGERSILPGPAVYAGGIVYWMTKQGSMIAFDLTSERSTLQYAYRPYTCSISSNSTLGEVNGQLVSAEVSNYKLSIARLSNAYTNTMKIGSRKKAWEVRHEDLRDLIIINGHDKGAVVFIGDDSAVIRSGKSLTCYNMKTKGCKQVVSEADCNSRLVPYVNSFVEI